MQNVERMAAKPDAEDPRDIVYSPTTLDVPERVLPDPAFIEILEQGQTSASVGFALAAVLNYLRAERGERERLSPFFLYENAKRYDEWAGQEHEGSSLRGALRGLTRLGAALERDAPSDPTQRVELTKDAEARALANRPASYERVERNIEHLKAAVHDLHAVLVAAALHNVWDRPQNGEIPYQPAVKGRRRTRIEIGAHAFAVIGYTERGFIVQNSWGQQWGGLSFDSASLPGCALWTFDDAAESLVDAWIVRLAAAAVVRALAGYSSDRIDGPDLLEIRRDAQAFSFVLASKEVDPPLAIGLFGDWGGGKSFFMEVMQQEIEGSVERARGAPDTSPFYTQVVSIRFNAWHYLDADLWASLVTEVFDRLFEYIAPKADLSAALKNELKKAQGLFEHAERQLQEATEARNKANEALKTAIADRNTKEASLAKTLNDVTTLLANDQDIRERLDGLAKVLGAADLAKSFDVLHKKTQELESMSGRLGMIAQSTLGSPGGYLRLVALAAVLLVPMLIAAGIEWLKTKYGVQIEAVHAFAAQLSTLLAGVTGWLGVQIKQGTGFVATLEAAHTKLEAVRKQRLANENVEQAKELQAAREREAAARKALQEAELRVRAVERELEQEAPGRRIYRFIEDRAKSAEYRSRLGIVSLVRRDFQHLSWLFEQGKEDAAIKQIMPVERIILYIDDLDRCKPDRVIEVLEAVHLLLAFPLFMVVVAVDPRWLRRCLEKHYPDLLALRTEQPIVLGDVLPSRPATAQDYLEKIFQVPFTLQPLRGEGFRKLVRGLAAPKVASAAPRDTGAAPSAPPPAPATPPPAPAPAPAAATPLPPVAAPAPPTEAETIQRVTISAWELRDIQRLASLFRTPRTVKRFINTYRFLRASLAQEDRGAFVGSEHDPGEYQAVIVLLAIIISYPNIALLFLQRLLDFDDHHAGAPAWKAFLKSVTLNDATDRRTTRSAAGATTRSTGKTANPVPPPSWEAAEWRQLGAALNALTEADFPPPQLDPFVRWLPRVARYSFSLSALLTLRR